MASIAISVSMPRSRTPQCVTKKQSARAKNASSVGARQETHNVTSISEGHKQITLSQTENAPIPLTPVLWQAKDGTQTTEADSSAPIFLDERWKNGTWDLNMFVKRGKMDWHALISAEAKRRRYLELYPEAATNPGPVMFRSSIIPWWAWITHSHLPEAEPLNGRAAMLGFFMSYMVDALTRLDVVGQTGNFMCKAALLIAVIGVLIFRRKEDLDRLQKLADEATFYDKQWQASWQDQTDRGGASD